MLQKQIEYQFTAIPTYLYNCLDMKCRSTLYCLIQLSTYYAKEENGGWFYRTYEDLEVQSEHSRRVLEATLDALYSHGIIDIKCGEMGRGMTFKGNQYKVLFDSFKKYEHISIEDSYKIPQYKIVTPKYNEKGYKVSFRNRSDSSNSSAQSIAQSSAQSIAQNDNNIDNKYNIENIEEIYNKLIINKEEVIQEGISKFDSELYSNSTFDILEQYDKELYSSFKYFESDEFCGKEKFYEIVSSDSSITMNTIEELFKYLIRAQATHDTKEASMTCASVICSNNYKEEKADVAVSSAILGLSEDDFLNHITNSVNYLISIAQDVTKSENRNELYAQAVEDCVSYFAWSRERANMFIDELFVAFKESRQAS